MAVIGLGHEGPLIPVNLGLESAKKRQLALLFLGEGSQFQHIVWASGYARAFRLTSGGIDDGNEFSWGLRAITVFWIPITHGPALYG